MEQNNKIFYNNGCLFLFFLSFYKRNKKTIALLKGDWKLVGM